jgi:hypothetical protein
MKNKRKLKFDIGNNPGLRICSGCRSEKPVALFPKWGRGPNGLNWRCKECVNGFRREWYRDHIVDERKRYFDMRLRWRMEMLSAYGGKCVCCGESEYKFLAIDHINGGGLEERKKYRNSTSFMKMLRELGWPKDRYQILCHNCNCAKGFYGECPHKMELKVAV